MNRTPDWGQASAARFPEPQAGAWNSDGAGQSSAWQTDESTYGTGAGAPVQPGASQPAGSGMPVGYQMLRQAGTGRYATVYLCREEATGHEVAVKLINVVVPGSSKRLAAHSELLSAGAAAKHPCAVTVEDAGFTADRRAFVISRFCRGGNAQAKLMSGGPFAVEDVLAIGVRLALALHSSHRRGVLHLDVRPANILYDEQGDALLSDHGVARVLQRCAPELGVVFDPMFSSRELFGWETPGPAADVYSLGATMYALLAGEPAYSDAGRTGWAALYQEILKGQLPFPARRDVPGPMISFLQRMMSAEPENRPPLTEVHRVLRTLLPMSYSSKVPDLEPEPAPEPLLPGWDPADDVSPEEESEAARVSAEAEAAMRRRNRNRFIAAVTVLVVFAGAATALLLTRGDDGGTKAKKKPAASPSASTSSGTGGVNNETARQVPDKDLPRFIPQDPRIFSAGSSVQVTWKPPQEADSVSGYLVTAATPQGEVLSTKNAPADERQVVFTSPPVQKDSCFVVTTLVATSSDVPQVAPGKPKCQGSTG